MKETKKIHCFFNAPYLGGAERSFINQATDLKKISLEKNLDYEFNFIIPFFKYPGEDKSLEELILSKGFRRQQILYFAYHSTFYSLGRSQLEKGPLSHFFLFLKIPLLIYSYLWSVQSLNRLNKTDADIWWIGGNKIGPLVFFLSFFKAYKGRLIWHFRDYLSLKDLFSWCWKFFSFFSSCSLEFIGNSYDVSRSIKKALPVKAKSWTLYNPVGEISYSPSASQKDKNFILTTASMFAPWKGIHFLVQFACLFEKSLKEIGISEFHIYGDEIYKTTGDHFGYKDQLNTILKKYKCDFVKFKGLKSPSHIFSNSDLFIHSSLRPEPFGRVVVESYRSGTPLISTALGGAGELIEENFSALTFLPYDFHGLLSCIETACSQERFSLIQKGRAKGDSIEQEYFTQLNAIFISS